MLGLKNDIPQNKIRCYVLSFSVGAVVYPILELLYRMSTHFTMVLMGGIIIYHINTSLKNERLITKALMSAIIITLTEFLSGIYLNVILKLNVWDYSTLPFNVLGQICPYFSFIWFLIAIPSHKLCDIIDKHLYPFLDGNIFFIKHTKEVNYRGKAQKTEEE